ncbi:type I restriction enzyme, S subunit [Bacillus sp. 153480037-1]
MTALLEHFHEAVTRPEDVDKLKKLILQLALQGKLVEQDPNDEPAKELLKKIEEEKQRLIKEKKIKKTKVLPPIREEEIPYKLPMGWEWVRLGDVSIINPRNHINDDTIVSFIPMKLIEDGFHNKHSFEIKKWGEIKKGFTHFQENDVVVAKITPCFENRKSAVMTGLENGYGAGTTELHVIRLFKDTIVPDYILWLLKSQEFISKGVSTYTGTAGQQRVSKDLVSTYLIPLPPLNMQKKIVSKIDQMFEKCDRLSADIVKVQTTSSLLNKSVFTRLQDHSKPEQLNDLGFVIENMERLCNDKESIAQLRNSILSLAVQGKLVEQDANEEPASILVEKIKEEKERLVAEKKIKKEKQLPPITSKEIPFELPKGWEWVRLGNITSKLGAGKTPLGGEKNYVQNGVKFIRSQNVWNSGLLLDGIACIKSETHESMSGSAVKPKDILLNITGASIGRSSLVPDDFDMANVNQHVAIIRLIEDNVRSFIHTCIISPYFQSEVMRVQVGASREGLSMAKLAKFIIALPPIEEQQRIAERVKNLFQLLDQYERRIIEKEHSTKTLFNSFMGEVV